MSSQKIKSNRLSSKQDVIQLLSDILAPLNTQFSPGDSGFSLGDTCAHYGPDIARMEGLSRALWGVFPLMASGESEPFSERYIDAIKAGTDPQSPAYWGETGPYDQRLVEMAVYGLGLALLQEHLTNKFTEKELTNVYRWLNQISTAVMPDNNWNYFAIMVQLGFKRAGLPWDQQVINQRFEMMEAYYLGEGWYSDGIGRPRDYYISMAFHFYGLIYATLNSEDDPQRANELRERARRFADDFIYMSTEDGAAIPFGRSLTYRFATCAFWCAVAFAELDVLTPGQIKGLILRNLRWWQNKPIFDRDGILTLGYTYPNLAFCEDYNSPGSPYWGLKVFIILAMPEKSPFWQSEEQSLPILKETHAIPHAAQIIIHPENAGHVYMLTSGQLELNNYVNTEAKYTKFAYSALFGFTIERGRFGSKHAACDSMLLLCENDDYWRGRRDCEQVSVHDEYIWSRWSPWSDVHIDTWLIPCGEWHVRVHRIDSARGLKTLEGGFAVMNSAEVFVQGNDRDSLLQASNGTSIIHEISPHCRRENGHIVTPPNSSIVFAECAAIPTLSGSISQGISWLCCAVAATNDIARDYSDKPQVSIERNTLCIRHANKEKHISTTDQYPSLQ
ncbi:DUF2264 domain-containing protein [Candidatus Symbiopectobacterium sp. NZEC135]|uniref:DUF2264 domain-containing protein n=1 Tax=Candidatus Symbiopectobacterium sp. NZEC135 TaxID=2820471 RepID=UPI0022261400|nr:DUF2264 domain-containing protein [Candidatus Symbiopectobacterium sp. NZEC135]MCW2479323.1 DUF2264 domain-containing protein [Candidatus Symbiopectobacterium sp. NZEC135]